MNLLRTSLFCAPALVLGGLAAAQTPRDGPPWWGVQDEVTVSLYWDFSGPTPLVPLQVAVPSWYSPNVTRMTLTGPLQVIPSLAGHVDVLGLQPAAAPALLALTVDNDPHLNWVKIFFFQFDVFEGAGGLIAEAIEQDLQQYDRSSVVWSAVPIGNGWETVTVTAELWPQPDDEGVDWSFTSDVAQAVGIDNLFVNSKCVKLDDADATGDALGDVDQAAFPPTGLDLLATTGADCQAAAVTEDPVTALRTYWVSAQAPGPGQSHALFRLDQAGAVTGVAPLPFTALTAPNGVADLAVVLRRPAPAAPYRPVRLYGLVYLANGTIRLAAVDLATGLPAPAFDVLVQGLPALPPQDYGLAYNPSGDRGAGTFLVTDPSGQAFEVAATTGVVLRQFPIPPGVSGAGYDHVFGNYYLWSSLPTSTAQGLVRTTGFEVSGYDLQPTGVQFWGSLAVPNAAGVPGGIGAGLEVYRRLNGDFRMACVALSSQGNRLYELGGPFEFGRSLHGRTRMTGQPFAGAAGFDILHQGRKPAGLFASLQVGFSNTGFSGFLLPFDLAPLGLPESQVLVALHMRSALVPQQTTGEFRFPMPSLPLSFRGSSLFFQWLVFDPAVQNGFAMSAAGKTLVY